MQNYTITHSHTCNIEKLQNWEIAMQHSNNDNKTTSNSNLDSKSDASFLSTMDVSSGDNEANEQDFFQWCSNKNTHHVNGVFVLKMLGLFWGKFELI